MADVTKSDLFFIWCLPLNLYSMLPYFSFLLRPSSQQKRFLRCSPFDEFNLWRSQVDNDTKKGGERLSILTRSLLLRRTKNQLDSTGKPLVISFMCVPGEAREGWGPCPCLGLDSHLLGVGSLWIPLSRAEPWVAVLPCVTAALLCCVSGSPTFREGWRLLSSLD